MTTRNTLDGKPYAENPHVAPLQCHGVTSQFDEGDFSSVVTPRCGSLLYRFAEIGKKSRGGLWALIQSVLFVCALFSPWYGACAKPVVSDVVIQQRSSRLVEVLYKLTGEKAIVTIDIQTNGVSIGKANFANAAGDINKEIDPSADNVRRITWQPWVNWPGHVIQDGSLKAVVIAHTYDAPPDYMVVDLTVSDTIRYYDSSEAVPGGVTNDVYKTTKMLFRKIPAAGVEWRMGSPAEGITAEVGRNADEVPHLVTFSSDYYMAVYETTYRQYNIICDSSYGTEAVWKTPYPPIYKSCRGTEWPEGGHTNVTGVAKKLRDKVACGFMFDLPTEAQWEFACRGGSGAAFCNGGNLTSSSATTDENAEIYAVYKGNATAVAEVGTKTPNIWNLFDMHGNYYEWCLDWYAADVSVYSTLDPKGPTKAEAEALGAGLKRVLRGGSINNNPSGLRSAFRNSRDQTVDYGKVALRLCCPVPMTSVD